MRRRPARSVGSDAWRGHRGDRKPQRHRGRRGRGRGACPRRARGGGNRGRRSRPRLRRAGGDARPEARPPGTGRGDGRTRLSDRRARRAARRCSAPARRRRSLPASRRREVAAAPRARAPAPPRLRARRRDGRPRSGAGLVNASRRRAPSLLESFNFAFEGVIHVLRTQRNLRIHFAVAFVVLIAAVAVGVGRIELIALMIAISFVLIAEMINSALEAGIDVATTSFDPLAKLAKDIAAGAVLIATVNAVAVGYLVFSDAFANRSSRLIERLRDAPAELTVIALVLTIILVLGTKAYTGRGTPLRGGLPSGHAAVAFGGWMAVTQVVGDSEHWFLITSLTFLMALLVAQTRIESGVHSFLEVVYGGTLGALSVLVIFQVFG